MDRQDAYTQVSMVFVVFGSK